MAAPSKLSSIWFLPEERSFATSVGALANNFGATVGFLVGLLVKSKADVPWLMQGEAIAALTVLLAMLVYFPSAPARPPSASASLSAGQELSAMEYARGLLRATKNRDFMLIAIAGGSLSGLFNAWSASLPVVLKYETSISQTQKVWLGFASMASMCLGSVLIGSVAERFFHRRFKRLSLLLQTLAFLAFLWFSLSLPLPFLHGFKLPGSSFVTLLVATALGSCFAGADVPVSYEFGVELVFPEVEALAVSFNVLMNNAVGIVFLFSMSAMSSTTCNLTMVSTCFVGFFMIVLTRESYPRLDREKLAALGEFAGFSFKTGEHPDIDTYTTV